MPTTEAEPQTDIRSFELQDLVETGAISPERAREIGARATFAVLFISEQLDNLSDKVQEELKEVDEASHDEARESGGLVAYVQGMGKIAYSACFWETAEDVARAMHGRTHLTRAVPLATSGRVYKQYFVKFNTITPDEEHGFAATPTHIQGHDFDKQEMELSNATV